MRSKFKNIMRLLVDTDSICSFDKPVKLTSGSTSNMYFDMRRFASDPEALGIIVKTAYQYAVGKNAKSVGGIEPGSIGLASAISYHSWIMHNKDEKNLPLNWFYVRKTAKSHGTKKQIEGIAKSPAVLIEDVVTTGTSLLNAIHVVEKAKIDCCGAIAILSRNDGKIPELEKYNCDYIVPRSII